MNGLVGKKIKAFNVWVRQQEHSIPLIQTYETRDPLNSKKVITLNLCSCGVLFHDHEINRTENSFCGSHKGLTLDGKCIHEGGNFITRYTQIPIWRIEGLLRYGNVNDLVHRVRR